MSDISFTVNTLSGNALTTTFSVVSVNVPNNIVRYVWDTGTNNLIYNNPTPTFKYKVPGIYTVVLSATDKHNNLFTTSKQITAEYPYRDYLRFVEIPSSYADPGKITKTPFKIEILTTTTNKPIILDLFAANSNSTPFQFVPKKWAALTPTWRFLDKNYNTITSLSVDVQPIYIDNYIVAVSGTAEFYYVDSMSTGDPTKNCPIVISVAAQTTGFTNINDFTNFQYNSFANNISLRSAVVWQVNDLFPNTLKITNNYYNPVYNKQWKDIPIPILITCHTNRGLLVPGASPELSEVLFSYPQSNEIGAASQVKVGLSGLSVNDYILENEPLYFQSTTDKYRAGGYIYTTITPTALTSNTCVFAETTASLTLVNNDDEFLYPGIFSPNSEVWVSNPENNTLNKITLAPDPGNCKTLNFFRENKILADGFVKQIEVPKSTNTSVVNYELSGFSGIYAMAVDPRNYDVIACDAELDKIYRITNNGEIIKTVNLEELDLYYNSKQKMFHSWTWHTPTTAISTTRFAMYGSTLFSDNSANYIVMVGGAIQPSSLLEIEPYAYFARLNLSPNYPQEGLQFDLIQLFHPTILEPYEPTLTTWLTSFTTPNSAFHLTNLPVISSLSATFDTTKFLVSIDGVLQHPDTYTIDSENGAILFSEVVPLSTTIHVQYLPVKNTPAYWKRRLTIFDRQDRVFFPLSESPYYVPDENSYFLINIGGKLQFPISNPYTHDIGNKQLIFKDPLPTDIDISIIQYSLPEEVNAPAALTPSSITLDRDYNVWVTLYNSVSVLKFDPDLNLLYSCVPNNIDWQKRSWIVSPESFNWESSFFANTSRYVEADEQSTDPYYNEFFAKPTAAETDQNNNCWVTYSHPLCSFIVKYSTTGEVLLEIPTTPYAIPTCLGINTQNNVWVSNFHGSSYTSTELSGSLVLYDNETGAVLSSVSGMSRPGYLAIDRYNNVWYTHGIRRIGVLNTKTAETSSWVLDLTGGFIPYNVPTSFSVFGLETYDELDNEVDEHIRGLSIDAYNRVWVLDSLQNFAWVISATPNFENSIYRKFKIFPDTTIDYYPDLQTGLTVQLTGENYYRSAQAAGDWTGNKWYQKYANQLLTFKPISGTSIEFPVLPFTNQHQIRRKNESFNTTKYYQSLALPENLYNNNALFTSFLPAVVGTGVLSANEDMGQIIYERIANFTNNHADIDTCGIKQLLSYAEETSIDAADYAASYPAEILNMLDIASIPRAKLWGIKNNEPIISESLGSKYNTLTDFLTAGTKIVLKSKVETTIDVKTVPPLIKLNAAGNTIIENIYPVSAFEGYGLKQPIPANYFIHKYEPVYPDNYIENIIDWDSLYTNQSINLSSYKDWYGDGGGIESAFRYLLTKNLFLK